MQPERRTFLKTAIAAGTALAFSDAARLPGGASGKSPAHPHLYYHREDLERLRRQTKEGHHARIWENMRASAEEYLSAKPPAAIPHGLPEIQYHDLYVTFYHSMFTMAILEHFTFCYVLSRDERYLEQARSWMNALLGWERTWGPPYLYSRYLISAAIYYDCLYDELSEREREQIRELLSSQMKKYEAEVLLPRLKNKSFSTHHATIYYCGGGVAACALLGEVPEAQRWLDIVREKFETTILPFGFGIDGGHQEGMTFWASQNHYRFFFLDALKNTTGEDAYNKYRYEVSLPMDWGIYSWMGGEVSPKEEYKTNEYIAFSADYGQLNYSAPALLRFASAYGNSHAQWIALRDPTLGRIEKTSAAVKGFDEKLIFCLGPFSYLWYDASVKPEKPSALPLARCFRGAEQVMMRNSWEDNCLFFGIEGRSPGSQGTVDFLIHSQGQTLVTYSQIESKNPSMNHLAPNTIEFAGRDELDATVSDFFSAPDWDYTRINAYKFQRHVFFFKPHYIVIFDDIDVKEVPDGEIRWQIYSMGSIDVAGPGEVNITQGPARLRLKTIFPPVAKYQITKERIYRTVGNGAVEVTADPNEYPRLVLPLAKEVGPTSYPRALAFLNVFYPESASDSSQVTGGRNGDTLFLKVGDSDRQYLVLWRMGRVSFAEDVYSDAEACCVQMSGNEPAGYGLQNGSILQHQDRTLFRARDWFSLGVRSLPDRLTATFKGGSDGEVNLYCHRRPSQVLLDGAPKKFSYDANHQQVGTRLFAGTGTLEVRY